MVGSISVPAFLYRYCEMCAWVAMLGGNDHMQEDVSGIMVYSGSGIGLNPSGLAAWRYNVSGCSMNATVGDHCKPLQAWVMCSGLPYRKWYGRW